MCRRVTRALPPSPPSEDPWERGHGSSSHPHSGAGGGATPRVGGRGATPMEPRGPRHATPRLGRPEGGVGRSKTQSDS
eukprot:scaffold1027_cov413-Prasinococcus_capsulatus_cf.AAC.4